MTVKVGINGFGRMGRLAMRAGWNRSAFEFTRVNETSTDAAGSAHLLKFDSVQGTWPLDCSGGKQTMRIEGHDIEHRSKSKIKKYAWRDCDIVIEATGVHHKTPDLLRSYFDQGVKKVVVAAPTEGALNIVYGINDDLYDAAEHHLLSAASCTSNCLAPLVKVMQENVGIEHGCITTIHDITNTQTIVDKGHKDLRRARACGQSLIPTSTGSARAIALIFPELEGKLNGMAVRVPLLNASITDFVFEASREVTRDEINEYFRVASLGPMASILGYEERPLVSADFRGDPRSSILDALSTLVIDRRQVKLIAWYDNEWGYANRLADLVDKVAQSL